MTTYNPAVLRTALLPRTAAVTGALVVASALLTAAAAQISIPLPFTPVPITGQTFAVLIAGTALGWRAGAAGQLLYVVLGAVGLPFYAGGTSGWEVVSGATGGYLLGFIVAAAAVGRLAEIRQDRRFVTSIGAMLTGNLIIYALGVPWLAAKLDLSLAEAVELGAAPFLIGDVLKIALAAGLLPLAWRFVRGARGSNLDS